MADEGFKSPESQSPWSVPQQTFLNELYLKNGLTPNSPDSEKIKVLDAALGGEPTHFYASEVNQIPDAAPGEEIVLSTSDVSDIQKVRLLEAEFLIAHGRYDED